MDFKEIVKRDIENQEKLLKAYTERIQSLPKGTLISKFNGEVKEYYFTESKARKRTYVNKNNEKLIYDLKVRKHLDIAIERMERNLRLQKAVLKGYKPYDYGSLSSAVSKSYRFDEGHKPGEKDLKHQTKKIGQNPLHGTSTGLKVRSKSEVIIVETLNSRDMDFRYEESLMLIQTDGKRQVVHPDFTFETAFGEKVYWEHFGMLSDDRYRSNALEKFALYISNNIMPGINLFITSDYLDGSLDVNSIVRTAEMIQSML